MNRSLFSKTPSLEVFDSRGLCIRNVAYHRHPDVAHETTAQVTHHGFNPQGFPVRSADPRLHDSGVENFAWITSLSGKALCVFSVDAGVTVTLHDAAGRPRQRTTQLRAIEASVPGQSEAVTCTWQYETSALPGRPLLIVESGPNGEERVLERFVYAGSSPAEQALNLAGQCVFHHDPAGLLRTDCVALTGVPLSVTRCLTEGTSDLNADAGFTTRTLADATCLAISVTDAKGNQRHFRYDRMGQLAGSSLTMAGAARQTIIEFLDYSAAGEKLSETHGNGLVTRYEYEPPTRRLTRIVTGRPAGHPLGSRVLLDLRYEYDPVGNVVRMSNEADKVRFWRNQKVEPVDTYVYDSLCQLIGATGREMANAGRDDGRWATRAASDDVTWTRYSRSYSYDRGGNLTCIRHSAPASGNNHTIGITVSDRSNRGVLADLADQPAQVDGLFTPGGQQAWLQPGQALRWTGRGELHEVVPVARAGAPDDAEYYRYDGNRQRVLKVSVRQSASVTQVHRVVYLPALELRHSTRGDVQVENFQVVTLGGAGCAQVRLLRWEAGKPDGVENDQLRYSYDNLQGSTSLEVDGHGRVVSQECYFPYGGTSLLIAGSSVEADYRTIRYSGKERDATGLYYYGYRYYQALAGRWSTGPVRLASR